MFRYLAVGLLLALPQLAAAESVSFGARLDQDGGHIGGSADSLNGVTTGRVHWSGNAITINGGFILGHFVHLDGTITRSNDPSLEGKTVGIDCLPGSEGVIFSIIELNLSFAGTGHVTVR
jgi:hypothetical protein